MNKNIIASQLLKIAKTLVAKDDDKDWTNEYNQIVKETETLLSKLKTDVEKHKEQFKKLNKNNTHDYYYEMLYLLRDLKKAVEDNSL